MFDSKRLASMRATQEAHMFDLCDVLKKTATGTDANGMPVTAYVVETSGQICGLNNHASREMINAEAHVYDARLRIPAGVVLTNTDRVVITHRFGEMVEPVTYDVIGQPMPGPSGQVVNLRSVI